MESRLPSFIITDKMSACFIERNHKIKSPSRLVIEKWLKWVRAEECENLQKYNQYVKIEIVMALEKEEEVWLAICNSNHIWCHSYLEGESGSLFLKMLRRAKLTNLQNKVFFDLVILSETRQHMPHKNEIDKLMKDLEENNNIRFLFWHEIIRMMK